MNIIDAIKSGKRYRRKTFHTTWFSVSDVVSWAQSDILADDWEIEEVRVTISASDLKTAWVKACENVRDYDNTTPSHWLCVELKKELGL